MSENNAQKIRQASIKNGLILALFALVSTGLISFVHLVTKDRIAQEIQAAMARRLNEIIASNQYDNDVYHDCFKAANSQLLGGKNNKIYRMRNKNQDYAIFTSSITPDGYSGKISLVIGIYKDGTLAGARVTEHKETPGLGDKIEIEKSNWIDQFAGRSLENTPLEAWQVKKDGGDFDALTGATITPRAVIKAIHNGLLFYQKNQSELFTANKNCGEKSERN